MAKAFPTEFPLASIRVIIDKLKGGDVSLKVVLEAAYDLVGYGLGLIPEPGVSHASPGLFCCPADEVLSKEDLVFHLEKACLLCDPCQPSVSMAGPAVIPWITIALTLADLLKLFMKP